MADGREIIRRYNGLRGAAAAHFSRCEQMAPFIAPSRAGITAARAPGADQMQDVYDSTAMFAADLLAKYIAGEVINPAQRWHRWKLRKPKHAPERSEADEWIEECTDRALKERSNSNFYAEAPEMLVDYGGFGTGCLMGDERKRYRDDDEGERRGFRGLRFQASKTGRFVISEDEEGVVDGVWREYTVSVQAAAERWGRERLPDNMRQILLSERPDYDRPFTIVHCVYPRPRSERGYGAKGFPFASCWVEKESEEIISESGYKRFPFMVARWEKTPGEIFGRGPGDRAFPDTRTLNKAKQMGLEDWALKIRPPIIVAHDSVIGNIRIRPAAPTTLRSSGRAVSDLMQPFETGSHPEISQIKEEELRKSIRQLFFVDQILQMLQVEKAEMTAYEFAKKMELLFKILGPIYGRMQSEFLIPETELTFGLMYDAGAFSPPPPELAGDGTTIEVEFTSPLALAQRAGDIDAIRMTFGDIGTIALGDPQRAEAMLENYDVDEAARIIGEVRGIPARILRSEKDRDQIRQARVQKMQQMEMVQGLLAASQAGRNVAPLVKNGAAEAAQR
ncbi:MAG TPA: portal protein [Candidatus Binatia bacterium]|jgi:hypothetical protein